MRYIAVPANPPYLYDTLLRKVSSVHETPESAFIRAYILNRFSTGACL
jgi:hypothetical protein